MPRSIRLPPVAERDAALRRMYAERDARAERPAILVGPVEEDGRFAVVGLPGPGEATPSVEGRSA